MALTSCVLDALKYTHRDLGMRGIRSHDVDWSIYHVKARPQQCIVPDALAIIMRCRPMSHSHVLHQLPLLPFLSQPSARGFSTLLLRRLRSSCTTSTSTTRQIPLSAVLLPPTRSRSPRRAWRWTTAALAILMINGHSDSTNTAPLRSWQQR